jgi:RNA recognition motif-containing protein
MTKLFVRLNGLDRNVSKEDRIILLQEIFADLLPVDESNVTVIVDKEYGGYRNFMFVASDDDDAAKAAVNALNDTVSQDGFNINVSEAKPQEQRERRPGGFSAGGDRGNGGSRGGYGADKPRNTNRY